jgi:hypothetical protein
MKRVDTIALSHVAMLLRLETSHQHTQSGLEQGPSAGRSTDNWDLVSTLVPDLTACVDGKSRA